MLAPFRITARMLEAGLICPTWQIRLHPSGERAGFDVAVLQGETGHPYRLQCEQSKYCRFALDAIRKLDSVTIIFNALVTGFEPSSDLVRITAKVDGRDEVFTADYLIGAD